MLTASGGWPAPAAPSPGERGAKPLDDRVAVTITSRLREFALIAHLTISVGWIGAVIAYLAVGASVVTSQDPQTVRAAWIAMEVPTGMSSFPWPSLHYSPESSCPWVPRGAYSGTIGS